MAQGIDDYKDRKCAVNENPSVCIESAGSKTSNNRPLKNGRVVPNFSFGNSSTFFRGRSCIQNKMVAPLFVSPRKNKGIFLSTR